MGINEYEKDENRECVTKTSQTDTTVGRAMQSMIVPKRLHLCSINHAMGKRWMNESGA